MTPTQLNNFETSAGVTSKTSASLGIPKCLLSGFRASVHLLAYLDGLSEPDLKARSKQN